MVQFTLVDMEDGAYNGIIDRRHFHNLRRSIPHTPQIDVPHTIRDWGDTKESEEGTRVLFGLDQADKGTNGSGHHVPRVREIQRPECVYPRGPGGVPQVLEIRVF
ncbi:hypothetical protein LIER_21301 [Lithospermum erythrorhizon]|uniref:Uncharacterized protein n=1 Tax=Lithospermum erythrorhizon TaxID=34254 RepID=A0AAV3QTV7_LITER